MGHRQSSTANWTVDDWAFGTGQNAVPLEDVIDEVRAMPIKYFGGEAIGNDASMHQMQRELLSLDEKVKRIFFRRKKNKNSKKQNYSNDYYYQDQQQQQQIQRPIYDQSQYTIPEENENYLPPIYADENQQINDRNIDPNAPWRCKYCYTQNKSTDIRCYQCKQPETN